MASPNTIRIRQRAERTTAPFRWVWLSRAPNGQPLTYTGDMNVSKRWRRQLAKYERLVAVRKAKEARRRGRQEARA